MQMRQVLRNAANNVSVLRDAARVPNARVLLSLAGPAMRGLLFQEGKDGDTLDVPSGHRVHFDWLYQNDHDELAKLYRAAKQSQWDADVVLDWKTPVEMDRPDRPLVFEQILPLRDIREYRGLPAREQALQRKAMLAWMLSQFLHGEQGALYAACQVTQSVSWMDGKLYGATQVVDEGRHVEVFHRYLREKLEQLYEINDNLMVILDALLRDGRWDMKFLGMQVLVEGLALGAFGTLRANTGEPLLRELLRYVITDEARHVHFGVVALGTHYRQELSAAELREREDWTFEMSMFLRNRFLGHEFYEEYYGHVMSRTAWDRLMSQSELMQRFRRGMFRRIIPNLKRINLLSERIRPHYQALGLLDWEHGKAAPELGAGDMLEE